MAEALAAVGLASSIIAFVDFAQKVVSRLNEFSNDLKDSTNALAQIQTQLPVIIDGLRRIKDRAESGKLDDTAKAALEPIVLACHRQTKVLGNILDSVLPASDASKWERRKKAFQSLTTDGKVKKASEALSQLLHTLTFYHSIGETQPDSAVKKSFWLVPFDRNPNFVGRDSLFDQIDESFKVSDGTQPKVALYGLGGIGKSQIALEYCFRKRHQMPTCSVFWVNAATIARFEESFQRMAKEFGINDAKDAQKGSLMIVKSWLETEFLQPWTMVIDNVDDETAFFREKCHNDKAPYQVLPRCSHGRLLFTSRTRDVAFDLACPVSPISVDFLTREEGLGLLRKRLGPDPLEAHLIELLSELDHIPLAVTQAISFILKRRKSVEQYLQLYRTSDSFRSRLLSHEFIDHGRQEQTMESVARTWQISFEWIQKNHSQAAESLCLMAFYQHHDVPGQLLRGGDTDAFEFDESIAVLQAFSLVSMNKAGTGYSTHRLIQVATKFWLEQNGPADGEKWALRALELLTMWFPVPEDSRKDDYWDKCQSLLPHADILLKHIFNIYDRDSDLEKAKLLLGTGAYNISVRDSLVDIQRRFRRSLEIRQSHLGSEHPDTWSSMGFYFQSLVLFGGVDPPDIDIHELADMGRALFHYRREAFGDRHPDTIQSLHDMARLLEIHREFEVSETMHREVLRLSEEVNGPADIETVSYMEALANMLHHVGKFEEALELFTESTKIRTKVSGPEHRTVLATRSDLALCLGDMGRVVEANVMGAEVMRLTEKVLGADHPNTLTAARNLALSLAKDERYVKALNVLDHVLSTIRASLRVYQEPYTAHSVTELKLEIERKLVAWQLEQVDIGSNLSQELERRGSI